MIEVLTEVYLDGFSDEERILLIHMFDRMVKNVDRADCNHNERSRNIMNRDNERAGETWTEEPGSEGEDDEV